MSYEYSEDALVETATQQVLEELGWEVAYAWTKETFGANGLLETTRTQNPKPMCII